MSLPFEVIFVFTFGLVTIFLKFLRKFRFLRYVDVVFVNSKFFLSKNENMRPDVQVIYIYVY